MPGEFVRQKDIAAMGNVSERTVERYVRAGIGPGYIRVGPRMKRFDEEAWRCWFRANAHPHRAAELSTQSETKTRRR